MTEYEACFIFRPHVAEFSTDAATRPKKRRKTNKPVVPTPLGSVPFVPLLLGEEKSINVATRLELFNDIWNRQERGLNELFLNSNSDAISKVVSYIHGADIISANREIPSGFIVAGLNVATHSEIFRSIEKRINCESGVSAITLDFSKAPNLKSALKHINRIVTNQDSDLNEGETFVNRYKGSRYLNYDLQILHDYVQEQSITKVVLLFPDSEAFQSDLIAELVSVLSSWNDRVPFLLLFGIATSIDLFKERLSRTTIRHLRGVRFDFAELGIEDIFKKVSTPDDSRYVFLGPNISRAVVQQHKNNIQSISMFSRSLKYIYMTHFFANSLSIFLKKRVPLSSLQPEHYEAIRNLPSFQKFAEAYLEERDYPTARKLLDDDEFLHDTIFQKLKENQKYLHSAIQAVEVIFEAQSVLGSKANMPWSDLYIQAMSGELRDSAVIKDITLSIRKLPSNTMRVLLAKLSGFQIPEIDQTLHSLNTLLTQFDCLSNPLRSEHDIHHKNLRTTVVAHKVELSKSAFALSPQDLAYSKIVNRVDTLLKSFLNTNLINPQNLFLHEIFIHDFKSPHRDAFAPKSRLAVERALSLPHDYLGCNCCEGLGSALSATQPPTAVLYQLYLESGALINVMDLWAAFYAIMGKEDFEDEEADQQQVLALFSRGLAELKYMGMIKTSRKKADHLTKLLWKGL